MTEPERKLTGLSDAEARRRLDVYGRNEPIPPQKSNFIIKIMHIIAEPMFLLLLTAAVIYFLLGEPRDGAIMLLFVVGIISIDVIQEWKTDKTLSALKDLSAPQITVVRGGCEKIVPSAELVPGDVMFLQEGVKVPADGFVIKCSDLCADESSLTGEPEGVWKQTALGGEDGGAHWRSDYCYAGTLITRGTGFVEVDKTGADTEYGRIGADVASAPAESTPLQKQTASLVKTCAVIAAVLFAAVAVITFVNIPDQPVKERLIKSILSGITLAMAMIPEEFPVIQTVFLSMGAWRLAKKNSLVRRMASVETLGAVSVLCVDKTGTITMNKMTVRQVWSAGGDEEKLCEVMGLGCETETYDPMEKAMLDYCESVGISREHIFGGEMISEYAFTDEMKMMGHVWEHDGRVIIAAKGSPEKIMGLCDLDSEAAKTAAEKMTAMGREGLRVIAVAVMYPASRADIPAELTDCRLTFLGLIGLADPPRPGVKEDLERCRKAGIRVVMITGDSGVTAAAIAAQIGMPNSENIITGDMLEKMSDEELKQAVADVSIFARVVPEHKMRIVKAFKANGAIVAMTGDGVNDAPALKYADIGIAMGRRGSEVSREAADLILMDDNFSTIVDTVADGRRIYDNIRKAVGYIFSIHIPIALSSLLAPMLGINTASLLLLPLHVVLLELVIDPTCSVVLERQPAEGNLMDRPPRTPSEKLLDKGLMLRSVALGLTLFAGAFGLYYSMLVSSGDALTARTMGLAVMILGNLLLVHVISSNEDIMLVSCRKMLKDKVMWLSDISALLMLAVIMYTPLNAFLKLAPLSAAQLLTCLGVAAAAVMWYELVKVCRKSKKH